MVCSGVEAVTVVGSWVDGDDCTGVDVVTVGSVRVVVGVVKLAVVSVVLMALTDSRPFPIMKTILQK